MTVNKSNKPKNNKLQTLDGEVVYLDHQPMTNISRKSSVMMKLEKLDLSLSHYVGIDAEWYQLILELTSLFLTKQFTFFDESKQAVCTIVLWNEKYRTPTKLPDLGHPLFVIPCDVQNTTIFDVCTLPKKLDVMLFFSPKDLEAAFGRDDWRALLLDDKSPISKKRNLTGLFTLRGTEFYLRDLFGTFNTSLDKGLISVGIDNPFKHLAEKNGRDKNRMDLFMKEDPNEFLQYAVGDTIYLMKALGLRIDQVNVIIQSALPGVGIVPYVYEDFPMSSGSLVAHTNERWLIAKYPSLMRAVLTISDTNNNRSWHDLKKLRAGLENDTITLEDANKALRSDKFQHGLGMCSITNFPLLTTSDSTALFGSVVQGGRCINEDYQSNPYSQRIENVVDIDLSSCYGSALRKFDYPFGIPTVNGYRIDDNGQTLGQVLKLYEGELVDGLFTIVVKGTLKFEQDLVHSKYGLDTKTIIKKLLNDDIEMESDVELWGREIEKAHVGGDFALTYSEIENGIITAHVLETILKVSTNQELKEWMSLEVVAVTAYLKRDEISIDEWSELMMTQKGRGTKTHEHGDKRTGFWCRLPMKEFIGSFVDYRRRVKKESEKLGKQTEEGRLLDLLQNGVKLFINTTYGCLASPYFPMGNTVLANNITAQARVGSWLMSKALGTVQSITDGGMFDYKKVFHHVKSHGNRKPGFHTLANRQRMNKYRNLKLSPLTDKDVYELMKNGTLEDRTDLDNLCKTHIDNFLNVYGLSLPFDIVCKHENTAREAVYFGSADYLMSDVVGDSSYPKDEDGKYYKLACRGAKDKEHPKQKWLWHLLDPSRYELPQVYYQYLEMVGVNDFKKFPHDTLMPGDNEQSETFHHPSEEAGKLYATNALRLKGEMRKKQEKSRGKKERQNFNMVKRLGLARQIEDGKLKP